MTDGSDTNKAQAQEIPSPPKLLKQVAPEAPKQVAFKQAHYNIDFNKQPTKLWADANYTPADIKSLTPFVTAKPKPSRSLETVSQDISLLITQFTKGDTEVWDEDSVPIGHTRRVIRDCFWMTDTYPRLGKSDRKKVVKAAI